MKTENHNRRSFPAVGRIIGLVIGGIVLAVVVAFLFGYFVMLLWNWLMPQLFGLPEINYWMAFGIILLSKLLFGGHGGHSNHKKHHDHHKHENFKNWVKYGKKCKEDDRENNTNKWKYYHEYWKEEGKDSFEKYVNQKTNKGTNDEVPYEEVK